MRRLWEAVALALVLTACLAAQVPVDLRPLTLRPPRDAAIPAADLRQDFLALRGVLDDLWDRASYLRFEALRLDEDARALWDASALLFQGRESPGRRDATPLRSSLFAFRGKAARLEREARAIAAGLAGTEGRWRAIRARRDKESVDAAREEAAALAVRLNELDADVRSAQSDLDALYAMVEASAGSRAPGLAELPKPWHWNYMLRDAQRPSLRYEFDARYREELRGARKALNRSR